MASFARLGLALKLGWLPAAVVLASALVVAGSAGAAGRIEINHARALAGGVTPGDGAGYPVTISQSGSYVLTGNLTPTGTADGITIGAGVSGVTLDLAGFAILGPVVCTRAVTATSCNGTAGRGVFAEGGNADITVKDGGVRGMQDGLSLSLATSIRVDRIHATSNTAAGIRTGAVALVERSSAHLNGQNGIQVQGDSIVRASAAKRNGVAGILGGQGCTLSENVVAENSNGIVSSASSTLIGNTAAFNVDVGLSLGAFSGYADSVLTQNNGNTVATQTNPDVGGAVGVQQIGVNVCGTDTVCP